jgi:hypothetical protein
MKKQLVIIGIVSLFVTVGLSGCNSFTADKDRFVGTWYETTTPIKLDLFSNGTCSFAGDSGTWDVKDGKLVLMITSGEVFINTYHYVFSDNDKTLELTCYECGDSPRVFTKQ